MLKVFTAMLLFAFGWNSFGQAVTLPNAQVEKGTLTSTTSGNGKTEVIEIKKVTTTQKPARKPSFFSFDLAPEYIYVNSTSDFWHRNYKTESPGYSLGFDFWFMENFGLNLNYRATVMASVQDNVAGSIRQQIDHTWFDWGLTYRVFADKSENAPEFRSSLIFREYKMIVPSDSTGRPDLKTTGVMLNVHGGIPVGDMAKIILQAEIGPNMDHTESSNVYTGRSGSSVDTFGIGLGMGVEYKIVGMSKFKFFYEVFEETQQFSGDTTVSDPVIGSTLKNVQVKNKTQSVSFAYVINF